MPVAREVIRAGERFAGTVLADLAYLVAAKVQFDEGIVVVTGHHQVAIERNQAVGAAMVLVPENGCLRPVPDLDIAQRVFDKEQLAVVPQRTFRVMRCRVDHCGRRTPRRRVGQQQTRHERGVKEHVRQAHEFFLPLRVQRSLPSA